MSVDVSPTGEILVFDLLGDLYLLPATGGEATPLTAGRAWDQAPRFSPAGESVYFVSDREGAKNVWRVTLSDRSTEQVTRSPSDIMGTPNWSQDGARLLAGLVDSETGNAEIILQSIDPHTGAMTSLEARDGPWFDMDVFERLRDRVVTFSGVQADDSGEVFFSEAQYNQKVGHMAARLYSLDVESQNRTAITRVDAIYSDYKPQLSHDGKLLSYFRQYNDPSHRDTGSEPGNEGGAIGHRTP